MIWTSKSKEPTTSKLKKRSISWLELKNYLTRTFGSEKEIGSHLKSKFLILTDLSLLNQLSTWLTCQKKTLSTRRTSGLRRSRNILTPICQAKSSRTVPNTKEDFCLIMSLDKNQWYPRSSDQDTMHWTWFISSQQEKIKSGVGLSENKLRHQGQPESFIQILRRASFAHKLWSMKTLSL